MIMADFPALRPAVRTWTPGSPAVSVVSSLSGYEVRVRHGAAIVGGKLELEFVNLLDADAESIAEHYHASDGIYRTFDLPAAVFAGIASFAHMQPAGTAWRYESAPSVVSVLPGISSVRLTLVSVTV